MKFGLLALGGLVLFVTVMAIALGVSDIGTGFIVGAVLLFAGMVVQAIHGPQKGR